jgi:hypothetical protein
MLLGKCWSKKFYVTKINIKALVRQVNILQQPGCQIHKIRIARKYP